MIKNRVREQSTTTGTGTIDLDGAVSSFQTYVETIGDGNTCYYVIAHRTEAEWEIGIGTVTDATPDTLSRDTVIESSNADAKVDFSAGTKDCFVDLPAGKVIYKDSNDETVLASYKTGFDSDYGSSVDISFTDGTRTFAIAPTGASFNYWINGTKYTITASDSVQIDDTEGLWFIYYEGATLTASQTPWGFDDTQCFVAIVYWDATNNESISVGYELHGWNMPMATHHYLHSTFGTRWESGLAVAINGTTTIDVTAGVIHDEDLHISIVDDDTPTEYFEQVLSPASVPILYRDGASGNWRKFAASTTPVRISGTDLYYNEWTGAVWQLSAVTNNKYVAYWVVASNDLSAPIFVVPGQEQGDTLAAARDGNNLADMAFGDLPSAEHKVIARLLVKKEAGSPYYSLDEVNDYRDTSDEPSGGVTAFDHGGLTGLLDDDHTQYYLADGSRDLTGDLTHTGNLDILTNGEASDKLTISYSSGSYKIDAGSAANFLDLDAAVGIVFHNELQISADSRKVYLGASNDAEIYFDGTDLIIDPDALSTGAMKIAGDTKLYADNRKLYFGAADDASIYYDGTDLIINPKEVGSGNVDVSGQVESDGYKCYGNFSVVQDSTWNALQTNTYGTGYYGTFNFYQANGSEASPSVLSAWANMGFINWLGYDGDEYHTAAYIKGLCYGTPGNDDMPGGLSFGTCPDGSKTVAERMWIYPNGNLHLVADNQKLLFGAGQDASIKYDGTNLIIDPQEVGSGGVHVDGPLGINVVPTYDLQVTGNTYMSEWVANPATLAVATVATGQASTIPYAMGATFTNRNTTQNVSNQCLRFVYVKDAAATVNPTAYDAGIVVDPYFNSSHNIFYGVQTVAGQIATGKTLTTVDNYIASGAGGLGSITTRTGLHIYGNACTTTTQYGIKIEDLTVATTDYAIYTGAGLVRFGDDCYIGADNKKIHFGAGNDSGIYYDGTDLCIDCALVGSGTVKLLNLPTSTPGGSDRVWNDSGTLKIT